MSLIEFSIQSFAPDNSSLIQLCIMRCIMLCSLLWMINNSSKSSSLWVTCSTRSTYVSISKVSSNLGIISICAFLPYTSESQFHFYRWETYIYLNFLMEFNILKMHITGLKKSLSQKVSGTVKVGNNFIKIIDPKNVIPRNLFKNQYVMFITAH